MTRQIATRLIALLATSFLAMTSSAQSTTPPTTPAQPPKKQPTPQELDRAHEYFSAGKAAEAHGDYKTAAADYLAAYQLFNEAEFFFDAAEMYRLAGAEDAALTYYQKYLVLEPAGRGAATAHAEVAELRQSIAAKASAADRSAPHADVPTTSSATEATAPQTPPTATSVTTPPAPSAPTSSPASHTGLRIAGIVIGTPGVVALGVGVAFGIRAHSISNEVDSWKTTYNDARYQQGLSANRYMKIFTSIGGAAVVVGSVLYYLGHRADANRDAAHTAVTLALPDGVHAVGLQAAGRF